MRARTILALVLVGACALLAMSRWASTRGHGADSAPDARPRIVSLSPAITETLFALGAGDSIVGVTRRCSYPPEVARIARIGDGTNPDLEAIAALRPTLIVGEVTLRLSAETLAPLAPTRLLPWLTPAEIVRGVRELGALVARPAQAAAIADRMERRLLAPPPAGAPRLLMVFADQPGRVGPIYFVKPGSLHDALLTAAGARNAVEGVIQGAPTLSLEGILRLDPDAIVILVADDELSPETRDRFIADYRKLSSLRAVREGHVRVLHGSILFVTGPRVLAVIDQVAAVLREMGMAAGGGARAEAQSAP